MASDSTSQRSLHNAPIFRLLLKVAVNGTHQCDLFNFCGTLCPNKCDSDQWHEGEDRRRNMCVYGKYVHRCAQILTPRILVCQRKFIFENLTDRDMHPHRI